MHYNVAKSFIHTNDNVCALLLSFSYFSLFIKTFLKLPKNKKRVDQLFCKKIWKVKTTILQIQSHTYVNIFSDTYAHSEKFSDGLN